LAASTAALCDCPSHRLYDLMQPCPTLRRDARAALIDLAAAALPAPAGFVVARAP
jgi:hypothetical protein